MVSRLLRKSSKTHDLMYSYQNSITVKEELAQLMTCSRCWWIFMKSLSKYIKNTLISSLMALIKKCSPSTTKFISGLRKSRKNTRKITERAVQDQVPLNPNLQLEKTNGGKTAGSWVNCRSFFQKEKERCWISSWGTKDGGRIGKSKIKSQGI